MDIPAPATFDRETFFKMAYGDVAGLQELAVEFFDDLQGRLPTWRRLTDEGNSEALMAEIHKTKGGAGIFALNAMAHQLTEAEKAGCLDLDAFVAEVSAARAAVAAFQ